LEGTKGEARREERIQPEEDAALLDEVAAVDAERGLRGLVDPILPRRRVPQLLVRQVERVDRRVDHLGPPRAPGPPLLGRGMPPRDAKAGVAAAGWEEEPEECGGGVGLASLTCWWG
jgi:hypothetical protein